MCRIAFVVLTLALLFSASPCDAQEKKLLETTGWGSLSGQVTYDSKAPIPNVIDLVPRMMMNANAKCCLGPNVKPIEKIDPTWIVDKKTRGVANVIVWIKPPNNAYFPLHSEYKPKKEPIVIDQPHCAFLPRVSAYNPVNIIQGKAVETGQKVVFKNSAGCSHNIRATGKADREKNNFNVNVPANNEITKTFEPQPLPIMLQCDFHTWMGARLAVFDHPYFAITKEDGTFEIPQVPAGAKVTFMAWHEGPFYAALPESYKGREMILKAGKNVIDFEVKAPK